MLWAPPVNPMAPERRGDLALDVRLIAGKQMLAGDGRRYDALAMIARAESEICDVEEERPPYLVFNATHLERWIGHTLVKLGDPAAASRLLHAAQDMDGSFTRASASLHLDLYCALIQQGRRDEASEHLRQAEQLARTVGSRRQLARLRKLRAAS